MIESSKGSYKFNQSYKLIKNNGKTKINKENFWIKLS